MAGEDSVKLLGYWASPFAVRVKWALELKGIKYEYIEENLPNKSPLLLNYNPVHKKVPVLVHEGKPLAESLLILEYIDETWKQYPLLPDNPYDKAKARFWAKFADDKCLAAILDVFKNEGEEQEKAAKEVRENLKKLESGLEGRRFFGGETIGFVDVAAGWIGLWIQIVEIITGINLIDAETLPFLNAWFHDVLEVSVIKTCTPPHDKLVEHNKGFHKMLRSASSST